MRPRGKRIRVGSPADRGRVDVRAAGIGQTQQPGHLVVRLPGGVVDGAAQFGDRGGNVGDLEQRRMTPGDEQTDTRRRKRAVLEEVDGHVSGQMVDGVQRLVERERQRLGGRQTDHQGAHEARTGGDGDSVHFGQVDVGRRAGTVQCRQHRLQVRAARHLGHDPPEPDVLLDTAGHLVGQQHGPSNDSHTGLVARRLDAENQGAGLLPHDDGQLARSQNLRINAWRPGP